MTLAVKTICLHNSLSFSSCFAMVKRIWRQGNIFWYFERGRFKEATDTTKIGKLFIISLIFQSVTLGICLEKNHLTTKLTRMNLYMFIYGNYTFPIYYSVPWHWSEKCNAINFRGWSLADLSCLPFFPKDMPKCTHKNHCIIQLQTDSYLPRNKHPWETLTDLLH